MLVSCRDRRALSQARGPACLMVVALAMVGSALATVVGAATAHAAVPVRAYVANLTDNTVSVIDPATTTLVTTVTVPGPTDVAPTPDGTRVYVTDYFDNTVSVVDTATNTVVATVAVGGSPIQLAITPDGSRAYVVNSTGNTVSVIDTAPASPTFDTVVATVTVGSSPVDVAITPDGTRAYVTNNGDINNLEVPGTVSVIDTATNTVVATVTTHLGPFGVAIAPDGLHAYVSTYENFVSTIDTATNTVVADSPYSGNKLLAVTPDGTRVYAADEYFSVVRVLDTATNTVVATIPGGFGNPTGLAISPDGSRTYVTGPSVNLVTVIDSAPSSATYNTVVATLTEGFPFGVAFTPPAPAPTGPRLACTKVVRTNRRSYVRCKVSDSHGIRRIVVVDTNTHTREQSFAFACTAAPTTSATFRIADDGNSHRVAITDCSPFATHAFIVAPDASVTPVAKA